jgi:hypothetical protein
MKTDNMTIITLAMAIFLLVGCKESITTIDNGAYNLIKNSSFEKFFRPSLNGWWANTIDTAFIRFSRDVPEGGGHYSISLRNEWSFPGTITYTIAPPTGTHRYQLFAWGKAIRAGSIRVGGDMSIINKIYDDVYILRKWYHFSDTTWAYATLTDTLTTSSADSVLIELRGNIDQISAGYVLFDLCKFVILD